ncbi:MAG: hypothetical protein CMJ46_07540 [Planctomyces sp.]|nr:hypothetical protein [Planctomyces sp.]
MRLIGKLDSLDDAKLFAEYLLSRKISSSIDVEDQGCAIWIIEEDQIDVAKHELDEFKQDPQAAKYREGADQSRKFKKEVEKQRKKQAAQQVNMRQQWEPAHLSQSPVSILLIGISILVALFSTEFPLGIGDKMDTGPIPQMLIVNIEEFNADQQRQRRTEIVREELLLHSATIHEYWRYFTPMFIHFGLLHILFNLMWVRDLGPTIEARTGSFAFLFIVLFIAFVSNVAQLAITGRPFFGGMSGVVFGFFGFIWLRGKLDPASGLHMPPRLMAFLVIYQIICFLGILGPIANWAHLFGFLSGAAIGGGMSLVTRHQRS